MEGNQQKILEALEGLARAVRAFMATKGANFYPDAAIALEAADAALSKPPRQCDVGTAEEQAKRMDAYCASYGERIGGGWRCEKCPLCSIDRCDLVWTHMPYEAERKGECDGR